MKKQLETINGWSAYHWKKYGRCLPTTSARDYESAAKRLGPPPLKLSPETLERIRTAGSLESEEVPAATLEAALSGGV